MKNISAAFVKAKRAFGPALKCKTNPAFKSKYADLGSVIQAVRTPFAAHGLSYVQFPVSGESSVGVTTRLMHSSGEWLEQDYFIPLGKMDAQAAGSAITYARRYALQSIAGIPAEDDDGNAATQAAPKLQTKTVTKAQAKVISDLIKKTDSDLERFCGVFGCESVDLLDASKFDNAKEILEKKLEAL